MKTKLAFKSQKGKSEILKIYDSLLEHWCSPNEKFYVNTRYGNTFIIASGKKENPPLILLPINAWQWSWHLMMAKPNAHWQTQAVVETGEAGKSGIAP